MKKHFDINGLFMKCIYILNSSLTYGFFPVFSIYKAFQKSFEKLYG